MQKKSVAEMISEILRNISAGLLYTAPFYAFYPSDCEDKPEKLYAMLAVGVFFAVCGIILERKRK